MEIDITTYKKMLLKEFTEGTKERNLLRMQNAIKKGLPMNTVNICGDSLLTLACFNKCQDGVLYLLKNGADPNLRGGPNNMSALNTAIVFSEKGMVEILLNFGADVNLTDVEGNNALMIAAKKNNLALAPSLIDKVEDVNKQNKQGQTALLLSLNGWGDDYMDYVESLLKVSDVNIQDSQGRSALHLAVKRNYYTNSSLGEHYPMINKIISYGIKLNLVDNKGNMAEDCTEDPELRELLLRERIAQEERELFSSLTDNIQIKSKVKRM